MFNKSYLSFKTALFMVLGSFSVSLAYAGEYSSFAQVMGRLTDCNRTRAEIYADYAFVNSAAFDVLVQKHVGQFTERMDLHQVNEADGLRTLFCFFKDDKHRAEQCANNIRAKRIKVNSSAIGQGVISTAITAIGAVIPTACVAFAYAIHAMGERAGQVSSSFPVDTAQNILRTSGKVFGVSLLLAATAIATEGYNQRYLRPPHYAQQALVIAYEKAMKAIKARLQEMGVRVDEGVRSC